MLKLIDYTEMLLDVYNIMHGEEFFGEKDEKEKVLLHDIANTFHGLIALEGGKYVKDSDSFVFEDLDISDHDMQRVLGDKFYRKFLQEIIEDGRVITVKPKQDQDTESSPGPKTPGPEVKKTPEILADQTDDEPDQEEDLPLIESEDILDEEAVPIETVENEDGSNAPEADRKAPQYIEPYYPEDAVQEEDDEEGVFLETEDEFVSRIMSVDSEELMQRTRERLDLNSAEGTVKKDNPYEFAPSVKGKKLTDKYPGNISKLARSSMMNYYCAFRVVMDGQVLGQYELIAQPLNPEHKTGKFIFWIQRWTVDRSEGRPEGSSKSRPEGRPFVNVSDNTGHEKETGIYRLYKSDGIELTLTPEVRNGEFIIRIEDRSGRAGISVKRSITVGSEGHLLFLDPASDTVIHIIPTDMENNENGYAPIFGAVETKEKTTCFVFPNGIGSQTLEDGIYIISAAWNEDVLYAKMERSQ